MTKMGALLTCILTDDTEQLVSECHSKQRKYEKLVKRPSFGGEW